MSYDINIFHYGKLVKCFENLDRRYATEIYNKYSADESIYTQLIKNGEALLTYQAERELSIIQRRRIELARTFGRSTRCAIISDQCGERGEKDGRHEYADQ